MQISKISNQNFGASPCQITKALLVDLERNNIDTSSIMRMIRDCYIGANIKTRITSSENIGMDMFSDTGNLLRRLIAPNEVNLHANPTELTVREPKTFARTLYNIFNEIERKRTPEQRAFDKVNGFFG